MKHNLDNTPAIPETLFTLSNKVFVIEQSTLEGNGYSAFHKMYADAIDCGFAMRLKSGDIVYFKLVDEEYDDESELVAWNFDATSDSIQKYQWLQNYTVVIFND